MKYIYEYLCIDGPKLSVDKLYFSHHDQLTLELVCSVSSNPVSDISWSRLDSDTGRWSPVLTQDQSGDSGVYTVHRQVMNND